MYEIPTLTMQQARESFADLVDMARWKNEAVQVTKYGKPVAYVVGPEWFKRAVEALGEVPPPERGEGP